MRDTDNTHQDTPRAASPGSALPIRKHGVVAVIVRGDRLLLIRRSHQVSAPGKFCFPGGAIEKGETEEEAVVRELREELGVCVQPVRRIWESRTEWGVHLSWWQSRLAEDAPIVPNAAEVSHIGWYTIPEILGLSDLLSSNREFLRKVLAGEIQLDWEP
ncbi:NUDIX domain-containing protein [Thermogutta sp.]|uniref:NUDIX domain-containing protein n=1 Tax=Thermogutta sp. TaxID=1962930 RepID=UPI0025E9F533|nr:NUDIX domain-containing protein [Thermogutta sp.]